MKWFRHASLNPTSFWECLEIIIKRKLTALFFFLSSSSCVGRRYWCRSPTEGCSTVPPSGPIYQALWADTIDFNEMLISPVMVHDHMPDTVLMALNKVTWSISHHILIFLVIFPILARSKTCMFSLFPLSFWFFFLIVLLFGGSHIIIGAEAREAACRISEANRRPLFSNHSVERLRIVGFIIFFLSSSPFIFLVWIASARISLFQMHRDILKQFIIE